MKSEINKSRPEYSLPMRDVAEEERPRERLVRLGADALKDAELLAILFRSGTKELNANALAEQVLKEFGNLSRLSWASVEELQQIKGIGRVKAVEIKAAMEFGKRLASYRRMNTIRIQTADDVHELLMPELRGCETERFICIQVNTKNMVTKYDLVSQGSADGTSAMPREVFRQALRDGATGVVVAHNHPSGDPEPSQADIEVTRRLAQAADLIGIRFLDHVIIGDGRHVSLRERGII